MDINFIKPYPKNAKKHTEEQIKKIAASIKEFGFNQPIVVDRDNVIIVGHGRFEAAKYLGLTDVPVTVVDLSPEKAKSYRLADNKLNESEWDKPLVLEELNTLSPVEIELTGFSIDISLPSIGTPVLTTQTEDKKSRIIFSYPIVQYQDILARLNVAKEKLGVGKNEDVLLELLARLDDDSPED